uniref:Uncharacterized protein n=1 Tax=Rhizophora mucronata TaxID=61149 RepID=A0A2P2QGH3_RHIMU
MSLHFNYSMYTFSGYLAFFCITWVAFLWLLCM